MVTNLDCSQPQVGCTGQWTNINSFERNASLGAGAALIAFAMVHRSPLQSLLIAGLGIGCVYRGVTGHCHFYEALGIDTAESAASDPGDQDGHDLETDELTHAGNRVDKDRFEKLKNTQVDRGRDEREAIEIAAQEVKELRQREGRTKEEFESDDLEGGQEWR